MQQPLLSQAELPHIPTMRQRLARKAQQAWQQLNLAQRFYFVALVLLALWLVIPNQNDGLLAFLGISLLGAVITEIWRGFVRLWHSLFGKALILLFYAVLANFSFALADNYVNDLIGVHADAVPFSTNLTVMLLAPLWGFALAYLLLVLYIIAHSMKLLALLVLRPFGVRSRHVQSGSFPVLTMLAQLICLPLVSVFLYAAMLGYATGEAASVHLFGQAATDTQQVSMRDNDKANKPPLNVDLADLQSESFKIGWLNRTVAKFIYHVESLNKSQCLMHGDEHLVQLNDFEVLVVTPDKTQSVGYQFTVRACNSPSMPAIFQQKSLSLALDKQ